MTAAMVRPAARGRWLRRAGVAAVVVVGVQMLGLGVLADQQAATVTGISPADGAVLNRPPARVALLLSEGLPPAQVHLSVSTVDGVAVSTGPVSVSDGVVTLAVHATAPAQYLIVYHAQWGDGRETSGISRFTVSTGGAGAAPPDTVAAAAGHVHTAKDPLSAVLVTVDAVLIVALLGLLLRRRPVNTAR